MTPRIVLLASDSRTGRQMLETLHGRGIPLYAVVVPTGSFRLASGPRALARTARRKLVFRLRRRAFFRRLNPRVVATGELNSARMLRDLRRLQPDFIVLGGVGVLKEESIATARRGVLNAHPALLPWVRGSGTVGHSLAQGIPLGATVHLVDRMIDTGAIVQRRLLPVRPGAIPLPELELDARRLGAEMMADVVDAIVRTGDDPPSIPQPVRYPLVRWPDANGRRKLMALAEAGRAHELRVPWEPLCPGGVIPPEMFETPPGE
jgi:folate-dependent phosphoribosylglycinamide formyltransferase PurN